MKVGDKVMLNEEGVSTCHDDIKLQMIYIVRRIQKLENYSNMIELEGLPDALYNIDGFRKVTYEEIEQAADDKYDDDMDEMSKECKEELCSFLKKSFELKKGDIVVLSEEGERMTALKKNSAYKISYSYVDCQDRKWVQVEGKDSELYPPSYFRKCEDKFLNDDKFTIGDTVVRNVDNPDKIFTITGVRFGENGNVDAICFREYPSDYRPAENFRHPTYPDSSRIYFKTYGEISIC